VPPPEYSVRVSDRARRVRLVMTPDRGLEVVVPRRFDRRRIPALVLSKQDWIARAAARVEARRRELAADPPRLPERIALPAVGEEWTVEYRPAGASAGGSGGSGGGGGAWGGRALGAWGMVDDSRPEPRAGGSQPGAARKRGRTGARETAGGRLVVTGDLADPAAGRDALGRWLRRKAQATLVPRLAELAQSHHLEYDRACVRQQKSRWGSCSRRGTISLNINLLFLPPSLVDHVLLHELCHTAELNHSARFWTLLGYHDPDCRAHRKQLRRVRTALPSWVENEIEEPLV